ncbi:hypothetical protein KGY73_03195 [bacterium]|nr:hypothetical protein [bacterium]
MKKNREWNVALVGTSSFRGKEMKGVLDRKNFPFIKAEFFDPDVEDEYSKLTEFRGEPRVIQYLDKDSLRETDLVFLASERNVNQKYGNEAFNQKYIAIDLNETFNTDPKVPLVVSGVNDGLILEQNPSLIANPHPVTIILSHVFKLFEGHLSVKKALAFVLQPVSAFEESGIEELADQSFSTLGSTSLSKNVFQTQIAFNVLSQTEKLDEKGFSSSENQVMEEIKRVFRRQDYPLSLSFVQAPVFHSYSIMAYVELKEKAGMKDLEKKFRNSPYFKFLPPNPSCPASSVSVAGKDEVFIGQIKKEEKFPNSFWIWIVADNLTRGSTLNALETAQKIISSSI